MTKFQILGLTIGWLITIIVGLLALKVVVEIWRGNINLEFLISDDRGDASLSRFQFLIFTFVVAMSLFYLVVIASPPEYPKIPGELLALLGISGGSYVVSKGIQKSGDTTEVEVDNKAADKSTTVTVNKDETTRTGAE